MQLITHQTHIDRLPPSPVTTHITARFNHLSENTDIPPNIVLVESNDDITGPDYAFVGPKGLLSDLFEEFSPGENGFVRPFENVSFLKSLQIYEVLLLLNNEDGYWILIPAEDIVNSHPDLHWVLTSEEAGGLSPPQPLY